MRLIRFLIFSLFLSSFCYANTSLITGFYMAHDSSYPLLLTQHGTDLTWAVPKDILNLPADVSPGTAELGAVNCMQKICIAAGNYKNRSQKPMPLLAISKDQGNTWTYVNAKPDDFIESNSSTSSNVFCKGDLCIIGDTYKNKNGKILPLFGISQDGTQWFFPPSILQGLPATGESAIGTRSGKIDCADAMCVAIGNQSLKDTKQPLLVVSHDKGQTWTYMSLEFLKPYNNVALTRVSCKEKICLISATYQTSPTSSAPLILRSTDAGYSWSAIKLPFVVAPQYISLKALFHTNSAWVLLGQYPDKLHEYNRLFGLSSIDEGAHWLPSNLPAELDADWDHDIYEAACTHEKCIVPINGSPDYHHTYAIKSSDGGITWSYHNISDDDASPIGISCDGDACTIIGGCPFKGNCTIPILYSSDQGQTWSAGKTSMPEGFQSGWLFSKKQFAGNAN